MTINDSIKTTLRKVKKQNIANYANDPDSAMMSPGGEDLSVDIDQMARLAGKVKNDHEPLNIAKDIETTEKRNQ